MTVIILYIEVTRFATILPHIVSAIILAIQTGEDSPDCEAQVIFSMLGEKVRMLVCGNTNTGYHGVTWASMNDRGIGVFSGISLYRLLVRWGNRGILT